MNRISLAAMAILLLFSGNIAGKDRQLRFIYCSDVHYGLVRDFRGAETGADSVSRAMLSTFTMLESATLPDDGGTGAGEVFGKPDFVICTGDIANRMEDGVQSATESWRQFCRDWSVYFTIGGQSDNAASASGRPGTTGAGDAEEVATECNDKPHLYLVPGNHDISNAIGYPKPLEPETDDASAAGIYHTMTGNGADAGRDDCDDFDYSTDKTHYSFVMDGIRFVFMGMWPDSAMREWYGQETAGDEDIPTLIFTHDPPEADAKHFTNPNGRHDINGIDKFQNLLTDTCLVRTTDRKPKGNWRVLEDFIRDNDEIKAYFHGDMNYNEFYTWHGPDGTVSLPVFRVDSPMKGFESSSDETLLSFIVVTVDTGSGMLTARECLWNTGCRPGIVWGESKTISL